MLSLSLALSLLVSDIRLYIHINRMALLRFSREVAARAELLPEGHGTVAGAQALAARHSAHTARPRTVAPRTPADNEVSRAIFT